jgi:hypothetical protein
VTLSDTLQRLGDEIKALPPGTEFEVLVSHEGTFVRGGPYGAEWTRWEPSSLVVHTRPAPNGPCGACRHFDPNFVSSDGRAPCDELPQEYEIVPETGLCRIWPNKFEPRVAVAPVPLGRLKP